MRARFVRVSLYFFLNLLAARGEQATAHLQGRVREAGTQTLLPATIAIRVGSGTIVTEFPGFSRGFRSDGNFSKDIPAGSVVITVSRGFDYQSITKRLELAPGQRVSLDFPLRRITPLHRLGWVAGDNHVHMIHGERSLATTFPYVALAARAEALDYLSVAQSWNLPDPTPGNLEEACARVSAPGFKMTWNLEAPKNYWRGDVSHCMGHGWTLGMRGSTSTVPNVIEELNAMSAHDYEKDKAPTPNFESHALIHQAGGIVSYSHPARWWMGSWGGKNGFPVEQQKFVSNLAQELPFDTIAGPTYDAIDILMQTSEGEVNSNAQRLWYLLLNHGYRIAATASSDSTFDRQGGAVPGIVRVYTHLNGLFSPERIGQQMKAGRNFVTSGPLVTFDLSGHEIGDVVTLKSPVKVDAHIHAWASGAVPEGISRIELVRNGTILHQWNFDGRLRESDVHLPLTESGTAWYIVRVLGPKADQIAITNPIYFEDSGYRAPRATPAVVTASIFDASSKQPLSGEYEVIQMSGRVPVVTAHQSFTGGKISLRMPATGRLRVNVPGYHSLTRSVFMDDPELLDPTLHMQVEQLLDWKTFDQLRTRLQDVKLSFDLKAE